MSSLVVMGVSGCGKSRVAAAVAGRLGLPIIEGDDFHSEDNRGRMRSGIALTDEDRAGWLDRLGAELQRRPDGAVLACSALKASYRDRLRAASPGCASRGSTSTRRRRRRASGSGRGTSSRRGWWRRSSTCSNHRRANPACCASTRCSRPRPSPSASFPG